MTVFLRWSPEKALEAYNLRLNGMTSQQIADSWHVTRNVIVGLVWRAKRQLGLAPLPKRPPKPRKTRTKIKVFKAPSAPRVVLSVPLNAPEPLYVTLMDLECHHCRWPEGLGRGLHSTYCGHPKQENSSYCSYHHMRSTRDIRSKA